MYNLLFINSFSFSKIKIIISHSSGDVCYGEDFFELSPTWKKDDGVVKEENSLLMNLYLYVGSTDPQINGFDEFISRIKAKNQYIHLYLYFECVNYFGIHYFGILNCVVSEKSSQTSKLVLLTKIKSQSLYITEIKTNEQDFKN